MRVMITGANGFVGRELSLRLLADGVLCGQPVEALLLLDQSLDGFPEDKRIRRYCGSVADTALVRRALADGVDVVFHLVSVPGGAAEANYEQGYEVNLRASLELLHQLRNADRAPRLVYASSIAVYGSNLALRMDEASACLPQSSYATHKLIVESQLVDLARRGEVDGVALRLPGIVARARQSRGLKSAFMSDLLQAFAAGEHYVCPVSAQATAWWMSVRCCVDNLVHAAELRGELASRVIQLPVLQLSIEQVLDALSIWFGEEPRSLLSFAPEPELEARFGCYPPLRTPQAKALGFHHDGSAAALLRNALNLPATPRARRPVPSLAGAPS
ncbi:NAD-dependent epimerase/dehydratase family protein [Pseudomonas sp. NEEL19]|uniref:NAD-dependent epimerase/dehydratase family protein n=1 Tax=Pseudomonas sp. NEEL19 TaxID=2867409 RepID=UPI00236756D8|nr:NAD-dependent epimerase/dehydratase family protein [Pseudomonas sp. NEEL19]WDM58170.1 NAD-dependent epimerase/dehydratase family protein [Pseudomonas sp. NEEL19]